MNSSADQSDRRICRVLIAEDNIVNQRVLIGMLRNVCEYEGEVAENGQLALAQYAARNGNFDLILMDCAMPVMSGIEATREIRDYEKAHHLPATPIVALTASAHDDNKRKCIAAGMDEFLTKPVHLELIRDLVHRRCKTR